jgi:hypothetical protein
MSAAGAGATGVGQPLWARTGPTSLPRSRAQPAPGVGMPRARPPAPPPHLPACAGDAPWRAPGLQREASGLLARQRVVRKPLCRAAPLTPLRRAAPLAPLRRTAPLTRLWRLPLQDHEEEGKKERDLRDPRGEEGEEGAAGGPEEDEEEEEEEDEKRRL